VPPAAVESPSVNLMIDPTGEVSVHSTHDHIFTADYHYIGATFPQQTGPNSKPQPNTLNPHLPAADMSFFGRMLPRHKANCPCFT